jgi:replication initiation and membrane attachment protein DnaB
MEEVHKKIQIRDLRKQGWYFTDNDFIDKGYSRILGANAFAVYNGLCRHADNKTQKTYVGIKLLTEELGISRMTVMDSIRALEIFSIVKRIRVGKMCNNRYYLIDKALWVRTDDDEVMSIILTSLTSGEVHSMYFTGLSKRLHRYIEWTSNSKETHSKATHSKETERQKTKSDKVRAKIQESKDEKERRIREIKHQIGVLVGSKTMPR